MARVLICSDSPFINTGFSTVARSIGWTAYNAGHVVSHLGFSDPRPDDSSNKWAGRTIPWPVYATQKTETDRFGQTTFAHALMKSSPQIVIIVADIWNIDHLLLAAPCPTAVLLHIEGGPLPSKVVNVLSGMRKEVVIPQVLMHSTNVITAGPFARRVVQERTVQYARVKKKTEKEIQALLKNTSTVIPDGVDIDVFKRIDRVGLKNKMFKLPDDAFIIGFFGRQNPRKGLPYAIQAFSRWKDRPANAYLYLHTAIKDSFGWNILQLLSDYNVHDKVIIDPSIQVGGGCSEEVLNMFYNACFAAGTPVRGEEGYRFIETIYPGDVVISAAGKKRNVLARSVREYTGPMVRVITNRTQKGLLCTPNHPFLVMKDGGDTEFVPSNDLVLGNIILAPHTTAVDGTVRSVTVSECEACDIQERLVDAKVNSQIQWDGVTYDVIKKPGQVPYITKDGVIYIASVVEGVEKTPDTTVMVYNIEVEEDHSYIAGGMGVKNCDITVLPSTGEGAGLTALESSAATTPVITTNYAEAPNYLADTCEYINPVGFWVDPGTNIERAIPSVDEITAKYESFYKNRTSLITVGERARKHIVDNFDIKQVGKKWLSIIESAEKFKPRVHSWEDFPKTTKKKICFFGSYFLPDLLGGGEITYYKLLKEFETRGWAPYCLVIRDGIKEENVVIDGINVIRIDKGMYEDKIRKFMELLKPDAVITTLIDPDVTKAGLRIAKDVGATTIYYEQFYNSITTKYRDVMRSTEKDIVPWGSPILSMCDLIYSNGAFVQSAMQKLVSFSSKILHPFIDFKDAKVENWDPQLVTMINPDPGKGGDTFLYIVKNMTEQKFLTVKVSEKSDYKALASVGAQLTNLEVWDFQKDIRKIYEKTKLLLMPTVVDETFGRVIQEAQSNGIPVIGRDVGGIRDTMGEGGILIGKYEDDDVWVETVRKVLADKDLYDSLSKKAILNASKIDYSSEMNMVFADVLKSRETPIQSSRKGSNLCLVPKSFHGVESVFKNLVAVCPGKVHILPINEFSRVVEVTTQFIDAQPARVLFGAWLPGYTELIQFIREKLPKTKIIITWFSNFSQMEFTKNELPAFALVRGMLAKGTIDEIWMSSESDAKVLSKGNPTIRFLPCPIDISNLVQYQHKTEPGKIKVSLFCTPGPRKNLTNQLIACSTVPGVELHLNGLSQTSEFSTLLQDLGIKYVDHGWMDKKEYLRVCANMDVALQVTYAETFNYVAAEHMLQGTPVIGSHMIPVMSWDPNLTPLIVDRADDPSEISRKIIEAATTRATLSPIVKASVLKLIARNNAMINEMII